MDVRNETDRNRLRKEIELSYKRLRPFRYNRLSLLKAYVGPGYGRELSRRNQYGHEDLVNLIGQMGEVYLQSLAAQRPQILVTSEKIELEWFAYHFQEAVNSHIEAIGLEDAIREVVLDSIFGVGIMKVYLSSSMFVQLEDGTEVDPGTPFASAVSLDNFVYDMSATRYSQASYAADQYRIPLDDLRSNALYDQEVVAYLMETLPSKKQRGEDERADLLSAGDDQYLGDIEDMVDVVDVWLPRNIEIATFLSDGPFKLKGPALRVDPWTGPERGPYRILSQIDVPDNIMGAAPGQWVSELAKMANGLMRKERRQAQRAKEVYAYEPGFEKEADDIRKASDGMMIPVAKRDSVVPMKMGGVDPGLQAFFMTTTDLFDRMAGNLQAMAGLGPQAETLGQDRLIHSAVSKKEAYMQQQTTAFVAGVCKDLGHLMWVDSMLRFPFSMGIDGADVRIQREWTPEMREGEFLDYNFEIEPYSMSYKSPSQRLELLHRFLTEIYIPLYQIGAQQGMTIDLKELLEIQAELASLPRLRKVVKFNGATQENPMRPDSTPMKPPVTTRRYERSDSPRGTQSSRSHVLQQVLAAGNVQANQNQMQR